MTMKLSEDPTARAAITAYVTRTLTRKILQELAAIEMQSGYAVEASHTVRVTFTNGLPATYTDYDTGEVIWPKSRG